MTESTRPARETTGSRTGPTRFRVVGIEDGMMLRQLLAKRLGVAPAAAAALVRAGGVYVGAVRMCVPTVRVAEGERVTVYRAAAEVRPVDPETLRVVHRDEACVIVDKPHGIPAAATRATSRGTLAHALVQLLAQERVARPYVGLVHALPVAAAGLAVFTIRGQATESFFKAFAGLAMVRRYIVRVAGAMPEATMTCRAGLVHAPSGLWRLSRETDRDVVAATSEVVRVAALGDETLATVTLTGAGAGGGEAVRLHLEALGLPVVGDGEHARPGDEPAVQIGGAAAEFAAEEATETSGSNATGRLPGLGDGILCLLAAHVGFVHPRTGVTVTADAVKPAWAEVEPRVGPEADR